MGFVLGGKGLSNFAKVGILILGVLLVILVRSKQHETRFAEPARLQPGLNENAVKFVARAVSEDLQRVASGEDGLLKVSSQDFMDWAAIDRSVTAKEYESAYDANEIAADNQYKDKKILITGTLTGVEKDFAGNGFLDLAGSNAYLPGVHAQLTSESMGEAARMRKGQHLNLVCIGAGRVVTVALLTECRLLTDYIHVPILSVEPKVNDALAGKTALPAPSAKVVTLFYAIGLLLPANSACLTNDLKSCGVEIDAMKKDPAKVKALVDKAKEIGPRIKIAP